jgi:hypothetical protein
MYRRGRSPLHSRRSHHRRDGSFSPGFYGRRSIPLNRPTAIIMGIGITLFIMFFFANFIFAFVWPDFFFSIGTWFFFIPFIIMLVMVVTIFITSIVTMFKGNTMMGSPETMFQQQVGIAQLYTAAQQLGFQVTMLPANDPSEAQAVLKKDQVTILVRVLPRQTAYTNGMVQTLSKGLTTIQAKEAWLIQNPPTFVENDRSFARFYNVSLLTMEEAFTRLNALSPSPKQGN